MTGAGGNPSAAQQAEQIVSDGRVELDRYAAPAPHRGKRMPSSTAMSSVRVIEPSRKSGGVLAS
jgi:hypothetical protein